MMCMCAISNLELTGNHIFIALKYPCVIHIMVQAPNKWLYIVCDWQSVFLCGQSIKLAHICIVDFKQSVLYNNYCGHQKYHIVLNFGYEKYDMTASIISRKKKELWKKIFMVNSYQSSILTSKSIICSNCFKDKRLNPIGGKLPTIQQANFDNIGYLE